MVSIIMPCYNSEKYISEAIKSVLNQSYTNFELIIIDDASQDKTIEVINEFLKLDPRITIYKSNQNFGMPSGPRNRGVKLAKFNWIAFIDSDDVWHPDKLMKQIYFIENNKNVLFVSCSMINFYSSNLIDWGNDNTEFMRISFLKFLFKFSTPTSSVIIHKSLFDFKNFNEDHRYKAREDLDLFLKFHEIIGNSYKLKMKLVGYRISDNQISGNKLSMVYRHFYVLKNYKTISGFKLGYAAILFTLSHFLIAFNNRLFKRGV